MPEGRYRFEFMLMEGERPGDFLAPEAAFRTLLADLVDQREADVERMASYMFRGCVASSWHVGRAFLAGDAAHLMPPFLGQGMCCGIRDVANLAWKLSEVLNHGAPEALLDTYEAECRPNVEYVIQSAIGLGQLISAGSGSGSELDPAQVNETIRRSSYHFSLPSLPAGPLVLEGGGEIFLQPRDAQGLGSDDVVGQRFLVLTQAKDLDAPAINWWRGHGAYVTTPELLDPSGEVRSWMSARVASAVVVRPDRYVLAAGGDLGAITDTVARQLDPEGRRT
jgi:3-(3-hydroxy-phenyl)propionate hydroxylase